MPKWTDEQKQVIESRDQSLLVSAAAGSGKTAVLVQRILDKILDPEKPVDIDRMLVVTFTNAAAASLREKIRTRLEEEAAGNNKARAKNAMRQISLLAGDHIETIDRFCREVVLDHTEGLGIDPAFRVADEGERKLLQSDVVSQVIEESYDDPDEDFRNALTEFSDLYAPGRTDNSLEGLILDFYEFSMSHEFPRLWRRRCARMYREDASQSEWMKALVLMLQMRMRDLWERLREALDLCTAIGGPVHYTQVISENESLLESLVNCTSLEEYAQILADYPWPRPGAKKRGKGAPVVDEALEKKVKNIRDRTKKELDRIRDRFFFAPEQQIDEMRSKTARFMDVLTRLTDRFEESFGKEKEKRGIADFSDVAHWALQVLIAVDEDHMPVMDENGEYVKTEMAREYRDRFLEIYIDEYQDSNRVQEILLQSISRPGGRFMVGDIKQSIYRFRMADTGIFLEKAASYEEREDAKERRIDLHRNFRSRRQVLDAVNLVFSQIMRREIGGIEYTTDQELRPGYEFPPYESAGVDINDLMVPELILAERGDAPAERTNAAAEARIVAERILGMVGSMPIYDKEKDTYRPAEYRDITILLRTSSGWAETFSRVLDEHGIPNRSGANTGYFDAVEVRTVLAYLNVLDNPRQDIALAASLRSLIGGLDDRELARIRAHGGKGSLYDCVLSYEESGKDTEIRRKLGHFLEMTGYLRSLVKDTPIHILLWKIFDETGYEDQILATEGGRQKKANLELMVDMAMAYEETSYRGLFHFVRYIEKLRKAQTDIGQAPDSGAGENLVRIMTMHKSKGLEFPIVFVSGLNKRFNLQDSSRQLVMHEHLGAGLDYRDGDLRAKMPNRISSVISQQIKTDSIGEELRVLYVAMTRAEQKLILSACVDSRDKEMENAKLLSIGEGERLPGSSIEDARGMLGWILAAIVRTGTDKIQILSGKSILTGSSEKLKTQENRLDEILSGDPFEISDPALHERLSYMLAAAYPYEKGREGMPAKLSVSELKRTYYEAELLRLAEEEGGGEWLPGEQAPQAEASSRSGIASGQLRASFAEAKRGPQAEVSVKKPGAEAKPRSRAEIPVPEFLQMGEGKKQIVSTAVGNAYHLILSNLDFTTARETGDVAALLETMLKCDKIQKEEADVLDIEKITAFLHSDLAGRIRRASAAGMLWREQPFVIGKKADQIRSSWSPDETVLIQGIIDAYFIEDEEIVLVDYKSDRAAPGDEESLVRRYRMQFLLYRDALEMLLRRTVKEAWLYSLSLGKAIRVDLAGE